MAVAASPARVSRHAVPSKTQRSHRRLLVAQVHRVSELERKLDRAFAPTLPPALLAAIAAAWGPLCAHIAAPIALGCRVAAATAAAAAAPLAPLARQALPSWLAWQQCRPWCCPQVRRATVRLFMAALSAICRLPTTADNGWQRVPVPARRCLPN